MGRVSRFNPNRQLGPRMFARFRSAHDQLAAEEFLVMQLGHRSLRFVHGLHLHKSEALGALIMFIAHDFRILHVADPVEEIKEIALRGIERQIADIKPWRSDFDRFRLMWRARL